MEKLSKNISYWFFRSDYIEEKDIDKIRFAIEVVLSNTVSFLTVIIIGCIIGCYVRTILFLLVFIGFRTLSDRYHAKTFLRCYILTVGSYLFCIIFESLIPLELGSIFVFIICTYNIYSNLSFQLKQQAYLSTIKIALFNTLFIIFNLIILIIFIIFNEKIIIFASLVITIIGISSVFVQKEIQ